MRRRTFTVSCVVISLVALMFFEWVSKSCFNTSLENLRIGTRSIADLKKGFSDQRPLSTGIPVDELDHYLKGYVWRSDRFEDTKGITWEGNGGFEAPKRKSIVVRWPSLIGFYKVLLTVDFRDRVTEFAVMSASDDD